MATSTRSRAYPSIPLKEACQDLRRFVDELGDGAHDRDAIAESQGFDRVSGALARRIAALGHYSLLDREESLYRPSKIGLQLLESAEKGWNRDLLQQCFLNPPVFAEVVEKYQGRGSVPKLLAFTLNRDHGITDAAKQDVASIFLASGVFAGVLHHDGSFTEEFLASIADPVEDDVLEVSEAAAPVQVKVSGSTLEGCQKIEVELSPGRRLKIEIPVSLTELELEVLEQQLSVFRVQVESRKAAVLAPVRQHRAPP